MRYLLAILLTLALLFSPVAQAQPDNVTRQKVWVDPRVKDYYLVHDQIAGDLNPGDGIVIWIYDQGPMQVLSHTTHLIAIDYELFIYCDLDWPDQKTGIKILESTEREFRYGPSIVPRLLKVISLIHQWQKDHPR